MPELQPWLGLATFGLAIIGCGDPDPDGFELISAAFADDYSTLILTFSTEVGPVAGVDPNDFRISMAQAVRYVYADGSVHVDAYYWEPNVYGDENYYDGPAEPVGMTAIAAGPMPNQISITLAPKFEVMNCQSLSKYVAMLEADFDTQGHFFPHYAPGGMPLKGSNGVALEPIGPDWVLTNDSYLEADDFDWPKLNPQIPIPCP